ncbi:DUF4167 domain-containing protein [Pseudochrobactrum sp. HB0163]|uniref:DUF4167 domain-containing protein n=1 Tax=Pseudochrobactrum sp. HB0163 TaxID=3450708 RepID=UPI003F6DC872
MRPGQQNRRMRGRGNNNRKGPNPLSRNYESNGPDVKIRGNAQHIAEKYMTLARDAQASGDRVIAENYLQHAEHYNRIILAAQAQNVVPVQRDDAFDDDFDDEDTQEQGVSAQSHQVSHTEVYDGSGPQPVIEGTPAEVMYGEENNRAASRSPRQQNNRQNRMQRQRRHQRPDYAAEQSPDSVPAPALQPAEQPVVADDEAVSAPVMADAQAETAAPVVRRRSRAAAAENADAADMPDNDGEALPAPRTRRVLRPRRTARAAKAEVSEQDQDTALAETE